MKIKHCTWLWLLLLSACTSAGPLRSTDPTRDGEILPYKTESQLPIDKRITQGRLKNGLQFLIFPNHRPENRAYVYLVVKAGSLQEDESQRGLAHFVEHMAFNGTKRYPKNRLVDALQTMGVRFGADLNASTGFDSTTYQLPISTDDPTHLETAMTILREWADGVTFETEEVEKERGVVEEERRRGLGLQKRLTDQILPLVFAGSRYADREPIGLSEVILKAPPSEAKRFYEEWYRPELMTVIVVGDVEPNRVTDLIVKHMASLKNPEGARPWVEYPIPAQANRRFAVIKDQEIPGTVVGTLTYLAEKKQITEADFREETKVSLFDLAFMDSLQKLTNRADLGFSEVLMALHIPLGKNRLWAAGAMVHGDKAELTVKNLWTEVERVKRFGVTEAGLERAKRKLVMAMEQKLAEKDKTASETWMAALINYVMTDQPPVDLAWAATTTRAAAFSATLQDMKQIAEELQRPKSALVGALGYAKANIPSQAQIETLVTAVEKEQLKPNVEAYVEKKLMTALPNPGTIVSEKKWEQVGITQWTLSNGMEVYLKPTDFEDEQIRFFGFRDGGTSTFSDQDYTSAMWATDVVSQGGLQNMKRSEINEITAGYFMDHRFGLTELEEMFSASSNSRSLETLLQELYLTFTQPTKDSEAFDSWRSSALDELRPDSKSPEAKFQDEWRKRLNPGSLRYRPIVPADLENLKEDSFYAAFKQRLSTAAGFKVLVVGSFDDATMKPLILRYLGSLPAGKIPSASRDTRSKEPIKRETFVVKEGSDDKAQVTIKYIGTFAPSRVMERVLGSVADGLEMELLQELREAQSGVYTVSASVDPETHPKPTFWFTINFTCAPKNAEKLTQKTLEIVDRWKRQGGKAETLKKVLEAQRQQDKLNLRANGYWMTIMWQSLREGWNLNDVTKLDELRRAVTATSVEQAARTLFQRPPVIGLLMPGTPGLWDSFKNLGN